MSDLINRQAAFDTMDKKFNKYGHCDTCDHQGDDEYCKECRRKFVNWSRSRDVIERILNSLPLTQPEIIRCKDCKHSEHWYRDKRRCFLWAEDGIGVFEDGFCNYAERRQDD